jgi:hypothetical protein
MTAMNTARLEMDPAGLYREEVFTDRGAGTIRVLTPVKTDGLIDASRKVLYVGEAQILTAAGVLPLGFEIEVGSLTEAVQKFEAAAEAALERALKDLTELRRQAASSLVVTDRMPGGFGGSGGAPAGGMIHRP